MASGQDVSGNGNHTTTTGAVTLGASGPTSDTASAEFTGGQLAGPANLDLTQDHTFEYWIKPNASGGDQQVPLAAHESFNGTNKSLHMRIFGDTSAAASLMTSYYGTNGFAATAIQRDEWVHLTQTHDASSNETRVYVDGVLVGLSTGTDVGDPAATAASLNIGAWSPDLIQPFTGNVGPVAFYPSVLAAGPINTHATGHPHLDLTCDVTPRPDGVNVILVTWDSFGTGPEATSVERFNGDTWDAIDSELELPSEVVDAAPPTAAKYRIVSEFGDGASYANPCLSSGWESYLELADIGVETLPDGQPGSQGSSSSPTRTSLPARGVPGTSPTPQTANDACSHNGMAISIPGGTEAGVAWGKLSIPIGTRVQADIINTKSTESRGSWNVVLEYYETNADGSLGDRINYEEAAVKYWWNNAIYPSGNNNPDVMSNMLNWKNDTTGTSFFVKLTSKTHVSIESGEGGRSVLDNIRYTTDTGITMEHPCDSERFDECVAAGGNVFLPTGTSLDMGDEILTSGCYNHETCLPSNGFGSSIYGGLQTWACENDALLEKAMAVGLVVVVVLGVIVVAPTAMALLTAMAKGSVTGLAMNGVGSAALPAGMGWLEIVTLAGVVSVVLASPAIMAIYENGVPIHIAPISPEQATIRDVAGAAGVATATELIDLGDGVQIEIDATFDALISSLVGEIDIDRIYEDNNLPSWPKWTIGAAATTAISECVVNFMHDLSLTQTIYDWAASKYDFSAKTILTETDAVIDASETASGEPEHLCEKLTIYAPGGISRRGKAMHQSTLHITEAIFGADNTGIVGPWTGSQSTVGQAGEKGQLDRAWLSYEPRVKDRWYIYDPWRCIGSVPDKIDCDEFPWAATNKGGRPATTNAYDQPHLMLINTSQNRTGGVDYGSSFKKACSVDEGEPFLVAPLPIGFLLTPIRVSDLAGLAPIPGDPILSDLPASPFPSLFICED